MTTNVASTTTYFVSNHYIIPDGGELTDPSTVSGQVVVTKYYGVYPEPSRRAGSQRIAMRTGGTLTYILGDHGFDTVSERRTVSTSLRSASLTTDSSGNVTSQQNINLDYAILILQSAARMYDMRI